MLQYLLTLYYFRFTKRERGVLMSLKQQIKIPIFSSTFIENPYPFYDELREASPIYWLSSITHKGWFVTGYEEANKILKDKRFQIRKPLPRHTKDYTDLKNIQDHMMLYKNPPEHTKLRKLFQKPFSEQQIQKLQPVITQAVNDLLNEAEENRKMDVIQDFAFPLPSLIISELLGIPKEDRIKIKKWTKDLLGVIDLTRTNETLHTGNKIAKEVQQYFHNLIIERRHKPKNDLISAILGIQELTEDEKLSTIILLMIAGHETTVNLIANSILTFLTNPIQLELLKQNPSLITSAIEECLRFESPTQITARFASETVKIGETEIKRGQQIYIVLGAANRDPKKFVNPHNFQITRYPNPHLAFGSGIHYCLGSQLARLEAQIAVKEIFEKFPNLSLQEETIKWRKLIGFRALQKLHVKLK